MQYPNGQFAVQGGYFDQVIARGMKDSALTFGTPTSGHVTTLGTTIHLYSLPFPSYPSLNLSSQPPPSSPFLPLPLTPLLFPPFPFSPPPTPDLTVVPERRLIPGDTLWVYLPQFTNPNTTDMNIRFTGTICQISGCISLHRWQNVTDRLVPHWIQKSNSLMFHVKQTIVSFHITMLASNGLQFPLYGSNNVTGIPTLALRTRNHFYFAPTPFKQFQPVAYVFNR